MKKIGLMFLVLFMFSCAKQEGVNFVEPKFSDLILLAKNQNKMIMMDFWSDG
jgi:hypothetical protein